MLPSRIAGPWYRLFALSLWWLLVSAPWAVSQEDIRGAALGSAAAARAQARRFLAGRELAGPSAPEIGGKAQALGRARAASAGMQLAGKPAATTSLSATWQPIGPVAVTTSLYGAVTGRVSSMAVDSNDATGNTVWLGTTGGGVWKSTNAAGPLSAVSFAPLTDNLSVFAANAGTAVMPSISIGALAVQPASTAVVLAGTGDPNDGTDSYYGEGILRSADGGQTWTVAVQSNDGTNGKHSFAGLATAGIAWSTASPSLAVAAMSSSAEGNVVAATDSSVVPGLYYSSDAGVTWHMATVYDGTQVVEAPSPTSSYGAPATAVVWNAQRGMFFAAISLHGYYSSTDGQTWTRLAHQPGIGLTTTNCPPGAGGLGSTNCPVLRGALAVQPVTGDLYALSVDVNNVDQGLWQDLCNAGTAGQCANSAPAFATRLDGGALEVGQGATGASKVIAQGDYDLALAAAPASNSGTILFAGAIDLYRCSLAAGASACSFRNTTNAGNGCNANAGVAPAQHALVAVAQGTGAPLLFAGNDGGLWRSTDGVAETGSACATSDASHFDNLNAAIAKGGSLAEVVGFAQHPTLADTLIAGLGANGSAATVTAGTLGAWPQLSAGEGGFPQIDPATPNNWYVAIGPGVNLKLCTAGSACNAQSFLGTATVGATETSYDAALLDAPTLLDPQGSSNLLTATCRVWRGAAQGGWTSTNALSPNMDGSAACSTSNALIRSLGAGGPSASAASAAHSGSQVLYAGMAGSADGGATLAGHVFVMKSANVAASNIKWTDVTGGTVLNNAATFNASRFDLSSVTVDTHDSTGATVYATIMGFGSGPHVYRSVDFGAHWTNVTANLPDAPANALAVDPNDANTVYLAMDTGVYVTQSITTCPTTNCWSLLGSGLPNAPVTQLQAGAQLSTGDGRVGMLRVGTYGRGLWQTPLLTAHGTAVPALSAAPASLSFAAQAVGTQSDVQAITLTNNGNAPAVTTTLAVTGDFVETDTCSNQTISVGATCTISVRFAPTATGARSGLLTVYANVAGGQMTVALSGTATAPAAVVLTPLQLTFAATVVNQTAAAQTVTVSNTGGNAATLQTPTITGDFAISANTCGATLASQTGCSVSVTFKPTASGTRTGVLTLVDSAGTQTAQLTGTGNSPATDTVSPLSLSFVQQAVGTSSAAQQVTLTNAGDIALTLVTASIGSGDFSATSACGTSLAAHSSCAVNVVFVPTATGTRTGTLQIADQFRVQSVPLTGAAVGPAGVSLTPTAITFDPTGVGLSSTVATLTLTNNGGVALTQLSSAVSGDFAVSATTCGTPLAAGSSCNFVVVFKPTAAGGRTGTLTLTDDAPGGKQTVALNGTGVDFDLQPNGPTSITVASGTTATYPLILTSQSGLTGTVAFTCSGAPANTVCTVNPSSGAMGSTVLLSATVQTGTSATGSLSAPAVPGKSTKGFIAFACMPFAFLLFGRRRNLRRVMVLGACLALPGLLSGCGASRLIPLSGTGGGSGTGTGGNSSAPTASGSYNLAVSGTAAGLTRTVKLTLVVQ